MSVDRPTVRGLLRHPRVEMAFKGAVAATLAWVVALRIPGAQDYAFYAPFGAVATTYSAVAQSVAAAVRTVAAILLGAALGLVVDALLDRGILAIALVVGVGLLLAGVPGLGDSRSYVPIAGMFVLLLGHGEELGYAASYAGLFVLGAATTVAVGAVRPALPVERVDVALQRLRDACVEHLTALATALQNGEEGAPARAPDGLTDALARARSAVDELEQATRGNRRARRDLAAVARRVADFRSLQRAVLLADDLQALAADAPWGTSAEVVPEDLRGHTSDALRELAATIAEAGSDDEDPGRRRSADRAVAALAAALRRYERDGGSEAVALVVSAAVTTLRRSLSALTPDDRIRLSPSPGAALDGEDPAVREST